MPHERKLTKSPLYQRSKPHPHVVDATKLSEAAFEELVDRQTPVLLKGAIRSWPAVERWTLESFASKCDDGQDLIAYEHALDTEFFAWRNATQLNTRKTTVTPAELFERFRRGDSLASRIRFPSDPARLAAFTADLDEFRFPFRPKPRFSHGSLHYGSGIVYSYQGGSFTDWHFHPGFEALMCQVRGTKEVLLLGTDIDVWRALTPALDAHAVSFEIGAHEFPAYEQLTATRVRIEAGDALYIPSWWWHVVEAVDDSFGLTVPHWWPSKWNVRYDFSRPAADYVCWRLLPQAVFSRKDWRAAPRTQLARSAMLGVLFMSPFPWLSTLFSGSHFGRKPEGTNA